MPLAGSSNSFSKSYLTLARGNGQILPEFKLSRAICFIRQTGTMTMIIREREWRSSALDPVQSR